MWYEGQDVVCIKDDFPTIVRAEWNLPVKGEVYRIKEIASASDLSIHAITPIPENVKHLFLLEECINSPRIWFWETFFKPVEYNSVYDLKGLLNNIPKSIQDDESKEMLKDNNNKLIPRKIKFNPKRQKEDA